MFASLETQTNSAECEQLIDYLATVDFEDMHLVLLTEPVKHLSDRAYDVGDVSSPATIGVNARGWVRAEKQNGVASYVCHASSCKTSSSCKHSAVVRDYVGGELKMSTTRIMTMKATIDGAIPEPSKYSDLQQITRWRRRKRPTEWNTFSSCICAAPNSVACQCQCKCICGSVMLPNSVCHDS